MKTKAVNGLCHRGLVFQIHLKQKQLEIPGYAALAAANSEPLRFNTENTAHYITDYQGRTLGCDCRQHGFNWITQANKSFKKEYSLLAESGVISYASHLPVIEGIETSYLGCLQFHQFFKGSSLFVDEGTEVEAAYKKLLVTFNQFNFERLGFEPKARRSG